MTITSYRLDDLLLFSPEVYFSSIAFYNQSIWPLPLLAIAISLLFFWLTLKLDPKKSIVAVFILALGWAWCGAIYHFKFYQQINWMAYYYGWVFIGQSVLMMGWLLKTWLIIPKQESASHSETQIVQNSKWQQTVGKTLIGLSVFALPLVGLIDGPNIKASLLLGLSPAPTLLATFGLKLISEKTPWWLLIIPVSFSIVGLLTSHTIGSVQVIAYLLCLISAFMVIGNWITTKRAKP
ncbi:MAG: hypothetical protein DHS20C07_07530 [Methyloligella sp.]|nr:MAG: hypothetical protein DHS20C07_07530 [Methyloligella sp.]